jgi:hypothetical protein
MQSKFSLADPYRVLADENRHAIQISNITQDYIQRPRTHRYVHKREQMFTGHEVNRLAEARV